MTRRLATLFAAAVLLSVGVACTQSQDSGDPVAKLMEQAFALEGDTEGLYSVGVMYLYGDGPPQDYAEVQATYPFLYSVGRKR